MIKIDLTQGLGIQPNLEKLAGTTKAEKVPSFADTLKGIVQQADKNSAAAGEAIKDFVAGKDIALHEVMATREESQISFQFMLEIRNKLMDAYQEVSRMQV